MLPDFLLAAGGTYPCNRSIFPPAKGGDAARLFAGRQGHVPVYPQLHPSKGGDAARFLHPLLGRCDAFFLCSPLCPLLFGLGPIMIREFWDFEFRNFRIL